MKIAFKYLGSDMTFDRVDRLIHREDNTTLPYTSASQGLQQACIRAVQSSIHAEHKKNPSGFGALI